jgi:UDP-N-acetylmuramate: L-alanyl-gamma-D-glutamyl-meso-diaminopimelate ligase
LSDEAIIFYDLDNLKLKKRNIILPNDIKSAFKNDSILIFTNSNKLSKYLCSKNWKESVLLMMSSGDFGGIKWNNLKSFFN